MTNPPDETPEGAAGTPPPPSGGEGSPPLPQSPPPPPVPVTRGEPGNVRNPVAVILLSIVTIGIYALYWEYASFKELRAYNGEGIGGGLGLLFAILLGIVNAFLLPHEIGQMYERSGRAAPVSALTGFWVFLPIVGGIIWVVKSQGRMNDFWETAATRR